MHKYYLEFIFNAYNASTETIRNALTEFSEDLEIVQLAQDQGYNNDFKICMHAEDPTIIFDVCLQLGRIKSIKVNEA